MTVEDKKVVTILLGSPRAGGNTETLAEALARGAVENGCEVRRVRLQGKKLSGCLDCRRCWSAGAPCVQKDDMGEVYGAIADADVVVFASPLYFYSWSTQIKPVWDRLLPFYGENSEIDLRGKKTVLVTAAGDDDAACFGGLRESFRLGCGYTKWEIAGEIYAPGMYPKDAVATGGRKYIEEAYELGKRL